MMTKYQQTIQKRTNPSNKNRKSRTNPSNKNRKSRTNPRSKTHQILEDIAEELTCTLEHRVIGRFNID
jgi:hypothetical protein